jgi:hypothetical protein
MPTRAPFLYKMSTRIPGLCDSGVLAILAQTLCLKNVCGYHKFNFRSFLVVTSVTDVKMCFHFVRKLKGRQQFEARLLHNNDRHMELRCILSTKYLVGKFKVSCVMQSEMCRTWIETGACRYGRKCQVCQALLFS